MTADRLTAWTFGSVRSSRSINVRPSGTSLSKSVILHLFLSDLLAHLRGQTELKLLRLVETER